MNVVLLTVAVNAAHALFEADRVPGDVVVHHQAAELEVDPFTCGIGRHEETGTFSLPKTLYLLLSFRPVHSAVDDRHLIRVAETLDAPHQEAHGVAVLGEDQPLVLGVPGIFEHPAKLLEIGFVSGFDELAGAGAEIP